MQQSYTGRGERLHGHLDRNTYLDVYVHTHDFSPLPQHISIRLLLCKHCSEVNAAWHYTRYAAIRNLIWDTVSSAAVISVSCDTHSVMEYRESRSPVDLGISGYGDPPKMPICWIVIFSIWIGYLYKFCYLYNLTSCCTATACRAQPRPQP